MARAIEVTRRDRSSAELRRAAKRCDDERVACRILAIAHVLDGMSRADAANFCSIDRQTLQDWVHRYNAEGIAGLTDAPRGGRPPALSSEQMAELKGLVLAGPDPARHGVVRCAALTCAADRRALRGGGARAHRGQMRTGWSCRACNRARIIPSATSMRRRLLKKLRFAFSRGAAAARGWQADRDMGPRRRPGVGQQGTLSYIWTERGSRPAVVRDDRHDSALAVRGDLPGTGCRRGGGDALGPACVKTRLGEGCAELFSQFPSSERSCQYNRLPHRRNRDGSSTRKLEAGVFTQPGSVAES